MSTVTTTITSVAACGKTTTVTTTEASPDAAQTSVVAKTKKGLASWMAGNLATLEGCQKEATSDCKISFANAKYFTNTDMFNDYHGPAGLQKWVQNMIDVGLDFGNPDNWQFAADVNNEFCSMTLPNQAFGVKSTGKYTEPEGDFVFVFFWPNGGDKLAGIHHHLPLSLNDCFVDNGVVAKTKKGLLASWVAGNLSTLEGCQKEATSDCKISFANAKHFTNTDVFHDYHGPAGLQEWCQNMVDIGLDFGNPDNWQFVADVNNEFCTVTLPSETFGVKSTGKYAEPEGDFVFVFFWPNGSDKLVGAHHHLPLSLNGCF